MACATKGMRFPKVRTEGERPALSLGARSPERPLSRRTTLPPELLEPEAPSPRAPLSPGASSCALAPDCAH